MGKAYLGDRLTTSCNMFTEPTSHRPIPFVESRRNPYSPLQGVLLLFVRS